MKIVVVLHVLETVGSIPTPATNFCKKGPV